MQRARDVIVEKLDILPVFQVRRVSRPRHSSLDNDTRRPVFRPVRRRVRVPGQCSSFCRGGRVFRESPFRFASFGVFSVFFRFIHA